MTTNKSGIMYLGYDGSLIDGYVNDTIGYCCGSIATNNRDIFRKVPYGIAVSTKKFEMKMKYNKKEFHVIETKNGPLSIGIKFAFGDDCGVRITKTV